ncbi:MAG: hypothetical protein RPU64_03000 [Candidatus Sedimenticola sp. (ex Thyasira tokunagai)]
MKTATFTDGVVIAVTAAVAGTLLFTLINTILPVAATLYLLVTVGTALYLVYLLKRSTQSVGRIVTLALWLSASMVAWFSGVQLPLYLLLQIVMIWLTRSLYFYSSLLPTMADLGLNILALAAAYWVFIQTQSIALTLWSFFLTQALFVYIPPSMKEKTTSTGHTQTKTDRFNQAHQAAQAAVRKLSANH